MSFYVYIIQSREDGSFYKGFTEDPAMRLVRHNNGESTYTRNKIPWGYVYIEEFACKRDALIRERVIKKYSHQQIEQLIRSVKNQVHILKLG
jgi:putative endonuclease